MHLVLQHVDGTATILVRHGQNVSVGRTEWADHSFPADAALEPIHFTVGCTRSGALVQPTDGAVLLLDGEQTRGAALKNGQSLQAGNTIFHVVVEGAANDEDTTADAAAEARPPVSTAEADADNWVSAASTLETLSLPPLPQAGETEPADAAQLAKSLVAANRHGDAIQVLAWSLPRAQAVGWAVDCIQTHLPDSLTEDEQAAVTAARTWCTDESEASSMAAARAAEAAGLDCPAGWVAQAAFWSGENLSEPGLPPVKPPPALPSAGVNGSFSNSVRASRSSGNPSSGR